MERIDYIVHILQERWYIETWAEFNELKESCNNKVYQINDTVIKINDSPEQKLEFEWEMLKKLEHLCIHPKFQFFEKVDIDGKRCEILWMKFLEGRSLQHHWKNYLSETKLEVVTQIIAGLKALHALHQAYFYDIQLGDKKYDAYSTLLKEQFEIHIKWAFNNPYIEKTELLSIEEKLRGLLNVFDSEASVLVHHDIWYKNILSSPKGFVAIIDFETAIFAPKQLELFRLLHHKSFAKQYLDSGSQDYTEMEFLELLLGQIELQYPDLWNSFWEEQFLVYNLIYYVSMLSKHENSWYDHNNTLAFKKTFISPFIVV